MQLDYNTNRCERQAPMPFGKAWELFLLEADVWSLTWPTPTIT
jgi:hypothetical protein